MVSLSVDRAVDRGTSHAEQLGHLSGAVLAAGQQGDQVNITLGAPGAFVTVAVDPLRALTAGKEKMLCHSAAEMVSYRGS